MFMQYVLLLISLANRNRVNISLVSKVDVDALIIRHALFHIVAAVARLCLVNASLFHCILLVNLYFRLSTLNNSMLIPLPSIRVVAQLNTHKDQQTYSKTESIYIWVYPTHTPVCTVLYKHTYLREKPRNQKPLFQHRT